MITGINHLTLSVADLERSFVFYRDILGLTPLCRWQHGAYFLAGTDWICLNLKPDYKTNPHSDYTHYAFSIHAKDFHAMKQLIHASGALQFQDNSSEGESIYFYDPDGHQLEIHLGDWQTRLNAKKSDPGNWQNVEFFI
jgi:catechol 2,3-dioxygenase-like lactoylglutathione lyase family enzyme